MPPCPSGPAENLQELDFPWAISHACGAMCVPQANVIIWVPLPGSSGSQRVPVIFSRLHNHACRADTTAMMMMMMGGQIQKRPHASLGQVWDQPLGPILAAIIVSGSIPDAIPNTLVQDRTQSTGPDLDCALAQQVPAHQLCSTSLMHPQLSPHSFTPCCIEVSKLQFPSLSAALT